MSPSRDFFLLISRSIYRRGAEVASAPLAFISIIVVSLFQLPAHIINRFGYLNIGILANEILAVLAVPIAIIAVFRLKASRLIPFRRISIAGFLAFVVFMLGAVVVMDYLTWASEILLPLPESVREQLERVMYAPDAGTFMMKLFVLCVIPAVCEEIYFRGFFQTSLTAQWGAGWAILVTSIVFAAMHGNFHYFHLYVLLGLIFGWAYSVSGTLWASIACHVLNNSWTFVNHVKGFHLPLEGASIYRNGLVLTGALTISLATAYLIRTKVFHKGRQGS